MMARISGNIVAVAVTDGEGRVRTRNRDKRGLVVIAVDAENHSKTYTYDLNGNTLTETDSTLPDGAVTYDALDRMVQAYRGPPGVGDLLGLYDYNHEGMRIRHRFGDRGDVDTYYDGGAVLEERRPDTGLLLARYRYGNRLISLDTGTDKRFYHTDGLGSTIGLTDPAGGVDTSYILGPWGRGRRADRR